jgi:hypothetical protein
VHDRDYSLIGPSCQRAAQQGPMAAQWYPVRVDAGTVFVKLGGR